MGGCGRFEGLRVTIERVSDLLWRERRLLELLLFKLEEEQLLLGAGRTRWLPLATRELETVLEEIHHVELERGVAVEEAAAAFGLGGGPRLEELAEVVPEPWPALLARHRAALTALVTEIEGVADADHDLLVAGEAHLDSRSRFDGDDEDEVAEVPDTVVQLQLQRVAHEAAFGAARAVQPSLLDFLG